MRLSGGWAIITPAAGSASDPEYRRNKLKQRRKKEKRKKDAAGLRPGKLPGQGLHAGRIL